MLAVSTRAARPCEWGMWSVSLLGWGWGQSQEGLSGCGVAIPLEIGDHGQRRCSPSSVAVLFHPAPWAFLLPPFLLHCTRKVKALRHGCRLGISCWLQPTAMATQF